MDLDKTSTVLRPDLSTECLDPRCINLLIARAVLRKKPWVLHASVLHSHQPLCCLHSFKRCRIHLLSTPSLWLPSLTSTSCSFYVVQMFAAWEVGGESGGRGWSWEWVGTQGHSSLPWTGSLHFVASPPNQLAPSPLSATNSPRAFPVFSWKGRFNPLEFSAATSDQTDCFRSPEAHKPSHTEMRLCVGMAVQSWTRAGGYIRTSWPQA